MNCQTPGRPERYPCIACLLSVYCLFSGFGASYSNSGTVLYNQGQYGVASVYGQPDKTPNGYGYTGYRPRQPGIKEKRKHLLQGQGADLPEAGGMSGQASIQHISHLLYQTACFSWVPSS